MSGGDPLELELQHCLILCQSPRLLGFELVLGAFPEVGLHAVGFRGFRTDLGGNALELLVHALGLCGHIAFREDL